MSRNIAVEVLEGLEDAAAYLDGKASQVRVSTVSATGQVDVRALRKAVGITQAEFSVRFGIPVDTLRKWERGTRRPDAVGKAYLKLIETHPSLVQEVLSSR